jgi:transposase InsO family protein
VNVDLCFVPWEHPAEGFLPAVSGSSGHLVIAQPPSRKTTWPGQVFQSMDGSYEQAMRRYAAQTRDRLVRGKIGLTRPETEKTAWRQSWEARAARHQVLQRRRQEDTAWLAERQTHHGIVEAYRARTRKQRAAVAAEWQAQKQAWAAREAARKVQLAQRKAENQAWHARNRARQAKPASVWIAILVVTDNATRQCWGLPVFASGVHVTTQDIADALREVLPAGLMFLISDQGTHFRSKVLASLAQAHEFVHIPIYRHRPQTNGIAERFVRSLKHDLHPLGWSGPEELRKLLAEIVPVYNNRPHQGLPIPGLSPIEFANRIWLM